MGEVINLRLARKQRNRRKAEEVAANNRLKHGRTKAEKSLAQAEVERLNRQVDGARRGPDTSPSLSDDEA